MGAHAIREVKVFLANPVAGEGIDYVAP